jgi:predicted dehydrogenase
VKPFRIGLIGCGRISDIYIKNCQRFDDLEIVACASLDIAESKTKAEQYDIPKYCLPEDIFADPTIDCVLNLTIPAAHASISLQALEAGKHVYSEKPFVTELADGEKILQLAKQKGLLVGNAPDTFLGGRWQTVKRLLNEDVIGKPTGVSAFVGTHGVERHNPNPDFYYLEGGGPLLDLGPYYLTAMIFFMGPISRVAGLSRKTFEQRTIENGPRNGEKIPVEIDTHSLSMIEFTSGAIGSMTMSFDIWDSETPRFEIYGEKGTICIADPDPVHGANIFQGDVLYRTQETSRWTHQPRPTGRDHWQIAENRHSYNEDSRGLGLLDLAYAAQAKRSPRASGEMAHHVYEVMESLSTAADTGQYQTIHSSCQIPEMLATDFPHNEKIT